MISKEFFEYFKKLAAHNHKDWFEDNKKWYESAVKKPFEELCAELISKLAKTDKQFLQLQPKDVIFRINRDIRFSNDKTPYKTNRSALIGPNGRKDKGIAGVYFELGPEENAIYLGAYMPEKEELANIRLAIATQQKAFSDIIQNNTFVATFGEVQGDKNKRLDETLRKAAEAQPLIFNNQFYIKHTIPMEQVLGNKLADYILEIAGRAAEFRKFLSNALDKK